MITRLSDKEKYVFRALLGILFLLSAAAKLVSIDQFEIYIFSFGWLRLGLAYMFARLVIAAEFFLGLSLIINIYPRITWKLTGLMLLGFTGFLAWLAISGNTDNCHCFGEFVDLDPVQSLLKNIVFLVVWLFGAEIDGFAQAAPQWLKPVLGGSLAAVCLATVLIVSPPDNWNYKAYSRGASYVDDALHDYLEDGVLPESVGQGDKVVCFISLSCEYCHLASQKIATLRKQGQFSDAPIIALISRGETEVDPTYYFEETGLDASEYKYIPASSFLQITSGALPLILVLHNGVVQEKYGYRDLH